MLGLDALLGIPDRGAPEGRGVDQRRIVILQQQIDRLGRATLEDDHVPAGVLHLVAEEAAGVGAGDRAGERPLGHHRIAPRRRGAGPGQGTGGHDQLVLRRQRIDLGIDLIRQVFGRQSTLAEIVLGPLHIERLGRAGALSQVNAQNFSCPRHLEPPSSSWSRSRPNRSWPPRRASSRAPSCWHRHR